MADYKIPNHEMRVIAFEDEHQAGQVLDALKQLEGRWLAAFWAC